MNIEEKEEMNARSLPDSFTIGTPSTGGALKVYFDLSDVKTTEEKLKNFFKTKLFIEKIKSLQE